MPRRPARCYTKIIGPPFTRKEYVRSIPGSKITSFESGNKSVRFPVTVTLYSKEACNVRHIALDAARSMTNKYISHYAGNDNYHFIIRVYPHHILREHKMMAFAGADRLQDGMRNSFGKATDIAARIKADSALMTIHTHPQFAKAAIHALKVGGDKLPTPFYILFDEGEELYKEYAITIMKKEK